MTKGYYGSNGEQWPHGGTPDWLLDDLLEEFGDMFDPCPNSPAFDGLQIDWPLDQWVFCNPPYTKGQISEWVKKCHDEYLRGSNILLLIPCYTDTQYFWDYIHDYAELRFFKGRLKFKGYGGKPASFPSMLAIYGGNINEN